MPSLLVLFVTVLVGVADSNVISNCAFPSYDHQINWSYQRQFAVYVEGNLMCGNRAYENALVELVELDYGQGTFDEHDLLNITVAKNGTFELCGLDSEISGLELVVRIHHNCNAPMQRERISCVFGFDRPDERYYELILRNVDLAELDDCTSDEL